MIEVLEDFQKHSVGGWLVTSTTTLLAFCVQVIEEVVIEIQRAESH